MTDSIQALVRADLEEREKLGIERYGTALRAHNGRDALKDAYEEALDLAVYLKQALIERDAKDARPKAFIEACSGCGRSRPEEHVADCPMRRTVVEQRVLDAAKAAHPRALHAPITYAEDLFELCDEIQRYQRVEGSWEG